MWKGYQQDQELSQLSMGSGKPSVAGKLLSWLCTQPWGGHLDHLEQLGAKP